MATEARATRTLFAGEECGERIRIACASTCEGELIIMRESEGELSAWCYGESPHAGAVRVGTRGASRLAEYLQAEDAGQLVSLVAAACDGIDAPARACEMFRRAGVSYRVEKGEKFFEKVLDAPGGECHYS